MTPTPHILVVEDDREIGALVAARLEESGCEVFLARDGQEMDTVLAADSINLVVLDVMLPGEDGLSLCRRLRASTSLPIIIVSARGDETDRIVGLEIGADDYLPKPFNPRELVARVRALIRRSTMEHKPRWSGARWLQFEGWRMDTKQRILFAPDGARVIVTPAEFDLLQVFCERAGRVLSRQQLIDLTHGRQSVSGERSVDILVSRLRRKLEPNPESQVLIRTVRVGGYEFVAEVVAD